MPRTPDLTPQGRQEAIEYLTSGQPVDLVVIGGGITGVGVALDASSRGLDVVLLEAEDLAFGTSRWSSKLVHGGLRYLANGQVAVAWESAVERGRLMRWIAPHLVHPMAQILPITTSDTGRRTTLTRAGLAAGDLLRVLAGTPSTLLPRSRRITASQVMSSVPALAAEQVRGGLLSWDGRLEDDARLVIAVARTAAQRGARIITGARVLQATGEGVVAEIDGTRFDVAAGSVISAVGVWAESFDPTLSVTPSQGTHLVIPADRLGRPRAALTVPVPGLHGRYCFLLPRPDDLVLAGITDLEVPGPIPAVPKPADSEVQWILDQLSGALARPLTRDDVIGTFAGLRPLVTAGHDGMPTADISRRHLVRRNQSGVVTIAGGKLTTYRRMAQDAVDQITDRRCVTSRLPLIGAPVSGGGSPSVPAWAARLARRYGTEAPRLVAMAEDDPLLSEPLAPTVPVLGVEIAFGIACEGARSVDDCAQRRTRLSLVPSQLSATSGRIAEILDRGVPR